MVTPVGVQTPSTSPRSKPFRPFPPSPSSPSAAAAVDATASHGLSERHLREIRTVFQIFDPDLSMQIDVPTFEVMARSLGFRMTQVEIVGMVELLWEEREQQQQHQESQSHEEIRQIIIDLPMAIQILAQRGYANRNQEDEMQMYFRIFDGGNKGYITLQDLQRVQKEVMEAEREMNIVGSSGVDAGIVGDATLQAMIEQFDENRDGVLDYEEFKRILGPVLSKPSASS